MNDRENIRKCRLKQGKLQRFRCRWVVETQDFASVHRL